MGLMGPWVAQSARWVWHVLEMMGQVVLSQQVTAVCVLSSPVFEPWAGINKAASSSGTVSPSTRKKLPELEAHYTYPSLLKFKKNVLYLTLFNVPSCPVHASLHPLYFATVSTTSQFAPAVIFVTIRCSQFAVITFLSLYNIQPFHILT